MRRSVSLLCYFFALCTLLGACAITPLPASVSYRGEPATVAAIELLWPNGEGMGSFVDSTAGPGGASSVGALLYRVSILFDDGQRASVAQDSSTPVAVGMRVWLEGGRVVEHAADNANTNIQRAKF